MTDSVRNSDGLNPKGGREEMNKKDWIKQEYSCVTCLTGKITHVCSSESPDPEDVPAVGASFDPCKYDNYMVEGGTLLKTREGIMPCNWGQKVVPGGICADCMCDEKVNRLLHNGCVAVDGGQEQC